MAQHFVPQEDVLLYTRESWLPGMSSAPCLPVLVHKGTAMQRCHKDLVNFLCTAWSVVFQLKESTSVDSASKQASSFLSCPASGVLRWNTVNIPQRHLKGTVAVVDVNLICKWLQMISIKCA